MTFKISNDIHTKQDNQKSFQTKRQHCCDPQCSGNKYITRVPSFETPADISTRLSVLDSSTGSSNTFRTHKNISLYFKKGT